jgi:hypothetical protein
MAGGQVIEIVLSWIVTNALTFVVVIADERRLREDQLERAWKPSSRDAAIVAFGVLSLPVHFIKTRGHFRSIWGILGFPFGLFLGLVEIVEVALIGDAILTSIAWVLGLPIFAG